MAVLKMFLVFMMLLMSVAGGDVTTSIDPTSTAVIASSSSVYVTGAAESYDCNKNFTNSTERMFSPNYPLSMTNSTECAWYIKLPAGQKVLFNLELFSVGANQDCSSMYLEVYDGGHESLLVDKYCGYIFQESVISTGNEMFVRMVFNKAQVVQATNGTTDQTATMFRLSYTSELSDLNSKVNIDVETNLTQSLSSLLYPTKYPHNLEQTWTLQAPAGQQVSLLFKQFLLENSEGCINDYLQVTDSLAVNKTTKYCGYRLGDWVLSKGDTLVLTLKTNSKLSASGFLIEYKAVSTSCNATYTNETGVLNYQEENLSCFWTIEVPFGYEILLSFDRFFFGLSEDCDGTSLSVRDGLLDTSPLIEKFCSLQTGEKLKSSGNELFISYEASSQHQGMGFEISYKAIEIECQNVYLNDTEGLINSPNYPFTYNSNSNCSWLIELDPQNIISLTFDYMEVEFSIGCENDYIMIYDGPSKYSPILGRYCGDLRENILSSGSDVYVEFVSNGHLSRNGFQLSYSAINTTTACNTSKAISLTEPTGTIYSTNFPDLYPNNHDCSWLITSEPGFQIHVIFEYFELESDELCQTDYVTFYNDFNDTHSSTRFAKHCGYIRKWDMEPVVSEAEVMFIRFHSNEVKTKKGFMMTYEAKETGTPIPPPDLLKEEELQAVKFIVEDTGLRQWKMEMYENFLTAVADAANTYCGLGKTPDCRLKSHEVEESRFKSKHIHLLADYPMQVNEKKDLLVTFYIVYPDGASDLGLMPSSVVLAIMKTYQTDIEKAIGSPITKIAVNTEPIVEQIEEDKMDAIIAVVVVMLVIILIAGLFVFWKFFLSKRLNKVSCVDEDTRKISKWYIQRVLPKNTRKRSRSDSKSYKKLELETLHTDA